MMVQTYRYTDRHLLIYVYICVCVCIYIYIYIYIYIDVGIIATNLTNQTNMMQLINMPNYIKLGH